MEDAADSKSAGLKSHVSSTLTARTKPNERGKVLEYSTQWNLSVGQKGYFLFEKTGRQKNKSWEFIGEIVDIKDEGGFIRLYIRVVRRIQTPEMCEGYLPVFSEKNLMRFEPETSVSLSEFLIGEK